MAAPRFARPTPDFEHIASAVALAVLLCTWIVAYPLVCPAEPAPHRAHLAAVRL